MYPYYKITAEIIKPLFVNVKEISCVKQSVNLYTNSERVSRILYLILDKV